MNQKLNKQLEKIFDENNIPKSISEIESLDYFQGDFNNLVDQHKHNIAEIYSLRSSNVHELFKFLASSKNKITVSLIGKSPYLIAVILSIFGISQGNYVYIVCIPLVLISRSLSAFITGPIFSLIMVISIILLFYNQHNVFAWFLSIFFISIFMSNVQRNLMHLTLLKLSLTNEKIFILLYQNKLVDWRLGNA